MYQAIITVLGVAKIANAIATGTPLNLSLMKAGDGNGNPTTPADTDTDLVRSVYDDVPNQVAIDTANVANVICELVIPASEGGWTIREVGIFDDDGDMIAVSQFPEFYKPTAAEGATVDMVVRMFLAVSNTEAITLEVDTSVVVATRQWVNNQLALLIPGGTTDQILTKNSNADGDYEWRNPTDVNVTVDIIQEEQTLAAAQTVINLATCTTEGLAVYIEGIRLHPPDWSATTATQVTLSSSYAAGSKIYFVQNEPVGESAFLAQAQNLADVPNKETARANLELLTNAPYLAALRVELNKLNYPVGEMFITHRSGNPSTLLGFGTWVAYAEGRAIVGVDSADVDFNELDKEGGFKTHTLTAGQMPKHRHRIGVDSNASDTVAADSRIFVPSETTAGVNTAQPESVRTSEAGNDEAHNNLQPYIAVFMWLRTA